MSRIQALPFARLFIILLLIALKPASSRAAGAWVQSLQPASITIAAHEHEDDDDGDEEDDDDDDDDGGLEWNDDDHIRGFGGGTPRISVAEIDRQLGDLQRVRADLDRRIAECRNRLKDGPADVDAAQAKAQSLKKDAHEAKEEAAQAGERLTQAQRDAALLFKQLRAESRRQTAERDGIECELLACEHRIEELTESVRSELTRSATHRRLVESARTAELRLELAKERQKEGRLTPGVMVESLNDVKHARSMLELAERSELDRRNDYKEARARAEAVRHRLAMHLARQDAAAMNDPRMEEMAAAIKAVREEHQAASRNAFDAARSQTLAVRSTSALSRQVKTLGDDQQRLMAAKAAVEKQIRDHERLRQNLTE